MMSLDRLIIRIQAVLDGENEGFEARALATEYAAHAEAVRERMRQCAALIRAGNDNAAFQAAETAPPLLDLAAKLAFDRAEKWREYCRENRLPIPVKIEEAVVEAVNELYAKEIGESHPLYRDYRAAVRERDDLRALGVLRSITRVNADDRNALAEHARLVTKIRREMLRRLEEDLREPDDAKTFATLEAMERAGIPPCHDDPSWREATRRREARDSEQVRREVESLARTIQTLHAENRFETLPALLGRLRSLEKQYALPPGDAAESLARIESETTGYAEHADRAQRDRELTRELLERLRALEETPADAPLSASARREEVRTLTRWLREAREPAATPELELAATRAKDRLRLRRRALRRRWLIAATALVLVGGAAVAGTALFTLDTARRLRDERFAERLTAVENNDAQLPALAFLDGEAKESPSADSATNRKRIALLRDRVERAETRKARVRETLDRVLNEARDEREKLADLRARLAPVGPEIAALPSDYREEEQRTHGTAKRLIAERAVAEPTRELEALLATPNLNTLAGGERFLTAMNAVQEALRLEPELDSETTARARRTLERAETVRGTRRAADRAGEQLATVNSFEALFSALKEIAEHSLDEKERRAAETVLARKEELAALPRSQLTPVAAAMARALDDSALRTNLIPAELSALEAAAAEELNIASRFTDVRVATRTTFGTDGSKAIATVYLKAAPNIETYALNGGVEQRITADVLKPDGLPERRIHIYRKFENRPASGELIDGVSPSRDAAVIASVAKAYDADRRQFTESPLALLDRVLSSEASPLVKAWVHKTVLNIVSERPAVWGVEFSPEFVRDGEALRAQLPVDIAPTDWMRAGRLTDLHKRLSALYAAPHRPYMPAARARHEFVRPVLTGGVAYAGRTDMNGLVVASTDKASPGDRICGLNRDGAPAVLGEVNAEGRIVLAVDAAPYSPLLRFATSPGSIRKPDTVPDAQEFFLKRP